MAAVLGGAQSLHTNSYDEALALPTEESALLALRTQQILASETGITPVADPLSGSAYLEQLCEDLEAKSLQIIRRVDEMGGMSKAIETGFVQREIQAAAFEAQKKIDSGEQQVVGVNSYTMKENPPKNLHKLDKKIEKDQLARIKKFKSARKSKEVENSLKQLELEAIKLQSGDRARVSESILSAVEKSCTLGEIADIFRAVAGKYKG
jgi:methylmalonyl-CoA mutase N-terminal domain/subunit